MATTERPTDELQRIRDAYQQPRRVDLGTKYAPWLPANLYWIQQLERELVRALNEAGMLPLHERRILDVGCGSGFWMRQLVQLGARPENLCGLDLLPREIERARAVTPHIPLALGSGHLLPYADASFDIITQFTVFSSILDRAVREQTAREILRVLKPDGVFIWYDFIWNPVNRDTRGVGAREIRSLFPGAAVRLRRVSLAPPLYRRLAGRSWLACYLLDRIPLLRTHYLGVIRKGSSRAS